MVKFLSVLIISLLLVFILPTNVLAAEEDFSASIVASYDVDSNGITTVIEEVTLKNKSDRIYPTNFSLTIGATQIFDISATDKNGPMEINSKQEGNKTHINVKLASQIVGIDKETKWTLKFKSSDFALKSGKVWQIFVPKMPSNQNISEYKLRLLVPVSFGEPSTLTPSPIGVSESGGKVIYSFDKAQLQNSGVVANFGDFQLLDFKLKSKLINNSFLPNIMSLPIPVSGGYQDVVIDKISPQPQNVYLDKDNNAIALFKVERRSDLDIEIEGSAKLYLESKVKDQQLSDEEKDNFTKNRKFWDSDNPVVKNTLETEVLKNLNEGGDREKALLIHRYVVNLLSFDSERLRNQNYQRLGSLVILNNPTRALSSEYTDLFITFARVAGISARRIEGYAYSFNRTLRPLSLNEYNLHSWPEYFDFERGWVMTDPTWESTSLGVDYFNKFDLNHFAIARLGFSSTEPKVLSEVNIKFRDEELSAIYNIDLVVHLPTQILAGIPAKLKIEIKNNGNSEILPSGLSINATHLNFVSDQSLTTSTIPPLGKLEFDIDVRANNLLASFKDVVRVEFLDQRKEREIYIKPFFEYQIFSLGIFLVGIAMFLIYLGTLRYHYVNISSKKGKKTK